MNRRMVIIGIVISLSVLLTGGGSVRADEFGREGNLELWIRTNKKTYEFGDPVYLTLTLKNRTTETLFINKRWGILREIDLEVFLEPEGPIKLRSPGERPDFRKGDFIAVTPGLDLEKTFDLNEILARPMSPGGYMLRGTYKNSESGKVFDLQAWTGEIVSNRLNIQVKPSPRVSGPAKDRGTDFYRNIVEREEQ